MLEHTHPTRPTIPDRTAGAVARTAGETADGLGHSTSRVEIFSDGVVAIAIALIVLDLTIDTAGGKYLLRALIELWPSRLAYLTNFCTIGLVWMGHHLILAVGPRIDGRLLTINLAILFVVVFLPFPTRLLTEFIHDRPAEAGSRRVLRAVAGADLGHARRHVALHQHNHRLLSSDFDQSRIDHIRRIFRPNIAFYAFAIALALILPQIATGRT